MKQYKPVYPDTSDWDELISPITLTLKKGDWEHFKEVTPRNVKLNDAGATDKEINQFNKDQDYHAKKKENK